MQIEDRGLKDVMFGGLDDETLRAHRDRIAPAVDRVVRRAQQTGQLRTDVEITDLIAVQLMVTEAAQLAPPDHREFWRRQLVLLLGGLRVARNTVTPLPTPALTLEEFEATRPPPHGAPHRRRAGADSPTAR